MISVSLIDTTRMLDSGEIPTKLNRLNHITVLLGKNGTGKSSLLRNVYKSDQDMYHLVVPERAGETRYSADFAAQELDRNNRLNSKSRNLDPNFRERAISKLGTLLQKAGFNALKGKTVGFTKGDLQTMLQIFLPDFQFEIKNEPNFVDLMKVKEDGEIVIQGVEQLSSGQAEALTIGVEILAQSGIWDVDERNGRVLLIDSPDAHLHLDLQIRFSEFLHEISERFNLQLIVTTHSLSLLGAIAALFGENCSIIFLDSSSQEFSGKKVDEHNQIISGLLSGDLLLAELFGKKVLLVEGNDDFLVWNQVIRMQSGPSLALISAHGSDIYKYKSMAESVAQSLSDSVSQKGITMVDGDGKRPATNKKGEFFPLKRLECQSLENLYFTEQVFAYLGVDLEKFTTVIDAKIDEFSEEEKKQWTEIKQDRRTAKVDKTLIKKIHSLVDAHDSARDWRVVLGKVIGITKPVGELSDFLGKDVMTYVWGEDGAA